MILANYSPAERAFANYVVLHLRNFASVIDVTRFVNRHKWSSQKLMELYMDVLWDSPAIFHVSRSIQFQAERYSDGTVSFAKLTGIKYAISKSEYQECKLKLEAEVKKATACAAGESAPEMIALRLHDYIVRVCDYDLDAAERHDDSPLARTVYSVLVRKKAVCEGYTMAYRHLLQQFNIMSEEILSDEMKHCWNYVNIRGKWYHVDVTFDDPVFIGEDGGPLARGGAFLARAVSGISREHFLMSDDKARRTDHYGWTTKGLPPADDKTFDNRIWCCFKDFRI